VQWRQPFIKKKNVKSKSCRGKLITFQEEYLHFQQDLCGFSQSWKDFLVTEWIVFPVALFPSVCLQAVVETDIDVQMVF